MTPLYELTLDEEDPVIVTATALLQAWSESAPEGVAKAFDLQVEGSVTVCESPRVRVRRIR